MKNILKKQNLMPVVVLGVICLLVAALMAVINNFTAPKIADYEAQKVYDSLRVVLDGHFDDVEIPAGAPKTVTAIFKVTDNDSGDFKGNVVTIKQKGYAGDILLTIGIDAEGKTTKVVITAQGETHGKNINPLLNNLSAGVTADNVADVDAVSGATVSSTAIKSAVADAFKAISGIASEPKPEVLPTSEEQILAYAKEMVGANAEFSDVTPEEREYVKRIYREKSGNGYVAYLVVMSPNYEGVVETETLVHVGNNGKISNIKKLTWKTSDAIYGYEPPSNDVVDPFYESLKGKNITELEELKLLDDGNKDTPHGGLLVTNASQTTGRLLGSLIEAIDDIEELIKKDMPTSEEKLLAYGKEMIGADAEFTDITPDSSTYVKKIYRENKGRGYLAYTVVLSPNYGTIETETLIYVGIDGKIKDFKKIIWKTSDAIHGYEPPSNDVVDPFYESLKGKNITELEELKLLDDGNKDTPHGGLLVTNASQTTGRLLASLIEGVKVINDVRSKDMPRAESEVIALAQQMAGEGTTLTNITPGNVEFLKRLYRIDNTNNYIAYVVVPLVDKYYNKVETETLIYIADNGTIKDVSKLTWNPSPEGNSYIPPEITLVDAFYESLKGKNITELEELKLLDDGNKDTPHGGLLVTEATMTCGRLLGGLIEAVESAEKLNVEIPVPQNNTPRIIGIVVVALTVISVPAVIIIKRRIFR